MPLSTPLPELNVTPLGNAPVSLNVDDGDPVAATENVPAEPTVNVAPFVLVIAAGWKIVSVKACVASLPTPLRAVSVMVKVPVLPAVPLIVAVPLP